MNYKIIALICLIVAYLFEIILLIIKKIQLKKPLPEKVKDIFEESKYEKFLQYSNEKIKLAFFSRSITFVIMFCLFFFDIFSWIYVKSYNEFLLLLFYILISTIIEVFFEYIETMKIENKFGFNTCTKKRFFLDNVISFIFSFGLLFFILFIIKLFYNYSYDYYYIFCGLILTVLFFIFNFFSPFFQRIFNKFTPLEGPLREKLENLVSLNNYKIKDISVMDASKRTTKVNAFFVGFGRLKRIGIYDTLLTRVTDDEIVAIFAHELGHAKNKDTLKSMITIPIAIFALMFLINFISKDSDFLIAFNIYTPMSFYANAVFTFYLIVFSECFIPLFVIIFSPLYCYISRVHERKADEFACRSGYGKNLYDALKKLTKENLSNLNPSKFEIIFKYTHPTIIQRLDNIEKNAHFNK